MLLSASKGARASEPRCKGFALSPARPSAARCAMRAQSIAEALWTPPAAVSDGSEPDQRHSLGNSAGKPQARGVPKGSARRLREQSQQIFLVRNHSLRRKSLRASSPDPDHFLAAPCARKKDPAVFVGRLPAVSSKDLEGSAGTHGQGGQSR